GAVRRHPRHAHLAVDAGDVHDRSTAGVQHQPARLTSTQECAGDVDVHDVAPLVVLDVLRLLEDGADAGAVHQCVEPAPGVLHLLYRGMHLWTVGDRTGEGQRFPAELADLFGNLFDHLGAPGG